MRFALRDLVLAALLASCNTREQDGRLRHPYLDFASITDCVDIVTTGVAMLLRYRDPDFGAIFDSRAGCLGPGISEEERAEVAHALTSEPHRTRFVRLMVSERRRALSVLARVPAPVFRPYLGVADQDSIRAAVTMDDVMADEPLPEAWRRWIAHRPARHIGMVQLLDALRDPTTACLHEPVTAEVRRALIRRVRQIASTRYRPSILTNLGDRWDHDPDPMVRRETIRLHGMGTRHRDELRQAARTDPDPRVRATAYAALEDPTGIPVPAEYLRSP